MELCTEDYVRFCNKVEIGDGCWKWRGTQQHGYGKFKVNRKMWRAHRLMYRIMVGPLTPGLTLDHLCRNKICVNPAHLEEVQPGINTLRGDSFSGLNTRKTHCPAGHKYDGNNLMLWGNSWRKCRICVKHNKQTYLERQRLKGPK